MKVRVLLAAALLSSTLLLGGCLCQLCDLAGACVSCLSSAGGLPFLIRGDEVVDPGLVGAEPVPVGLTAQQAAPLCGATDPEPTAVCY